MSGPRILRTPPERFRGLPDFGYTPHYLDLEDARFGTLRMAYLDEGPQNMPVALLLHGNPTWSFLYRKMIGPLRAGGYRVIAPDMIGFGRSDKLPGREGYSYQGFVDWLAQFVARLKLTRVILVAQDWGGPVGLRVVAGMPERFDAMVLANTLLPNGETPPRGIAEWPGARIAEWVQTCKTSADPPVAEIVAGVCLRRPDPAVLKGYDAPFPDASYKAGVLGITGLIPVTEDMPGLPENRAAWAVLERLKTPVLTAFSDQDPSTKAWEAVFQTRLPGAKGQPHTEIKHAGHFLQEEQGEAFAQAILTFLAGVYPRAV